jgi:hypothetical protein
MTSNEISYRQLQREIRRDRETERHNRATEGLEGSKQTETQRANMADEEIGRDRNQATRDAALFKAGASLGGAGIGLLTKQVAAGKAARTASAAYQTAQARKTLDALVGAGKAGKAASAGSAASVAAKVGSVAAKAAPVAAAFVPLAASIAYANKQADQKTPEEAALEYELVQEQANSSRNARRDKTDAVRKAHSSETETQKKKQSYDPRKRRSAN